MSTSSTAQTSDLIRTATGHWELDPAASSVRVANRTFWGLMNVKGAFAEVQGSGDVGADGSITGTLTISASSIDTGNAKRDTHLRSEDFFHAEKAPEITFAAHSVKVAEPGLVVEGTLAIRGVSRPLAVPVTVTDADDSGATLEAEVVVDRSDFGMTANPMGMMRPATTVGVTARFRRSGSR